MEGLTEGRIVHYVLESGPSAGQHRPASVVKVWSQGEGFATVNLAVMIDGSNDYDGGLTVLGGGAWQRDGCPMVIWKTSRQFSAEP